MGRFIGGRFGSILPVSPNQAAPPSVYNIWDQYYCQSDDGWFSDLGHTATGGIISDYTDPNNKVWRSHTFLDPGTFSVTSLSPGNPAAVEYLVVGGGGGGGGNVGGG